ADHLRELLGDPIPGCVCQLVTHAPRTHSGLSGPSLVGHPRLFRNGEGIHFEGSVHEQLVDRHGREIQEAVFTGIPVVHHGYLEPEAAMGERDSRNVRLLSARAAAEPSNAAVLFYLGMAQMGRGWMKEAAETLQRTLRLAGKDRAFRVKAAVLLNRALEPQGRDEEAEQVLRTALEEEPEHPELLCALGSELERQGRTEEALESYQAATQGRFGPTMDYQDFACRDVRPLGRLAAAGLAQGQPEAAASQARACLAIRPEATEVRHLLAAALLEMGQYAEARSELHAILGRAPDARAHNSLGVSLALEGRHEEAATEFKLALALEPEELDALCNLAHTRHAQGDLACARDTWEEALKERPSHVPAWLGLAKTYLESGAYQAGARCYEMAALHSGQAPEVMTAIADARAVLVEMGRGGQERESV
ncbi:MAG: tetratricopeptide repeat protein, partial [Armatimonadetes bacterium]|nr:tetratricopeptide repeat protein [Armatimonadota bacterium]